MMAGITAGVSDVPGMTDQAVNYFRDLYDHLIRLATWSTATGTC